MKKMILLLLIFISFAFNAAYSQMVVEGGSALYIENETMYVVAPSADVIVKAGGIITLRSGILNLEGSLTLEAGATIDMDASSEISIGGDLIVNATSVFTTTKTSKVTFKNTAVTQNITINEPSFKIGHLLVSSSLLNLTTNLNIMAGGKVEFDNALATGPVIKTNTSSLILESNPTEIVTWVGLDTGVGSPAPQPKYYVNGTIEYQTATTASDYQFPVGSATSLQFMKISFSPGVIATDNIKMFRVVYNAAIPAVSEINQNLCENTSITSYTGNWEYHAFSDITGATAITSITNGVNSDDNSYTITLNPRDYSVTKPNFTASFLHSGDAKYGVHNILSDNNNCFNSTNAGELVAVKVTKFSKVIGVEGDNVFPLELTKFGARTIKNAIEINWSTANVVGVNYFDLERSTDGINFSVIKSKIPVINNGEAIQNYAQLDKDVVPNRIYYYRLRSVENETSSLSNIIQAKVNELANTAIEAELYPNPTTGEVKLSINVDYDQLTTIELFDVNGRRILQKKMNVSAGNNIIDLSTDTSLLSSGVYNLIIHSENESIAHKLIKN